MIDAAAGPSGGDGARRSTAIMQAADTGGDRVRWVVMSDTIEALRQRMEAAAAALDFEEARRLRDAISLMRGGATPDQAATADLSGMTRQQPGAMGLGTSRQRVEPPPGWTPPARPDPMTKGRGRRRSPGS